MQLEGEWVDVSCTYPAEPLARAADRSAKMPDAGEKGSQRGAYAFQLGGVAGQVVGGGGGVCLGACGYGESAGFLGQPWMIVKLGGVVFMTGWHHYLALARKAFAQGRNRRSNKFWRMTNELPFLAAIAMVLAVTTEFGK